ncbi:hypothetical protein [Pseudoalteromonas luteoviolacea]|uniref:Uncharacterized protein n=1 Tax=Pseudoalteromonas luteoviolacea S4054 TaxID=1129367 RepID=A0A0F6A6B6_9GAMM|nr:hypothetical protein [Pseudoalteromonas luteoviolacea]AOT11089.1 hypothetical protein S4054249_24970 [Pseudoalteromonas luteoviolacea]AOT15747.1 hypothetical protein S40542_23540 [Pseudoalteromonas luteoviolacea]AOT20910.1 hypothetical protein S4054_24890 [Pseudoalteromonas luteoviolacea]KKE80974.1 hypothetical protein N479_24000 [Pseudoalteromonas luteoviolacea S4054]KZN74565.1 hypothetical protein N481_09075 [Pseudoalteromonas luteoviolacea S4047-1]
MVNNQNRLVELMDAMYLTVSNMREAQWLGDPQCGSEGTLAQEQALYERYQGLLKEMVSLKPDYLNTSAYITNRFGEQLSFAQAQKLMDVKIKAYESGNKKRAEENAKEAELMRRQQMAEQVKRQQEEVVQNQAQALIKLKQSLAPWRSTEKKPQPMESELQKHIRLHALAEQFQFVSYIDSFQEVYQALRSGVEVSELAQYLITPEQDEGLYTLLCIVDDLALYQGKERNLAPGSNFTRLLAVQCQPTRFYERYTPLPSGAFALVEKRRIEVKMATDLAFQPVNALQEVLVFRLIDNKENV